jgi:cytochrome c556
MNVDDQFLHRLRREPPIAFAVRLKWQLDRPLLKQPSRTPLLLVFAIFGTAFALVSPPVRHTLGELFGRGSTNPGAASLESTPSQATPAASTDMDRDAGSSPSWPLPRSASELPHRPPEQLPPAESPLAAQQPLTPDTASLGGAAQNSNVVSQIPNLQTPLQKAIATVDTRRGLFRLLSLVMQPLESMLAGRSRLDMRLAGTGAHRLNQLASMIPEVLRADTRAFNLDTHALDTIWTQPGDFGARVDALTLAADELERAATTGDAEATLKAIGHVQASCIACHEAYLRN